MVSVENFGHGVYFYEIATNTRMFLINIFGALVPILLLSFSYKI